jgi:hypothetical protein
MRPPSDPPVETIPYGGALAVAGVIGETKPTIANIRLLVKCLRIITMDGI